MKIAKRRVEKRNNPLKALGVRARQRSKAYDVKEVEEEKPKSQWSDLPEDIIRLVIGKLYWSERIRVGMVCKSWLINPKPKPLLEIQSIEKLPWVMFCGWERISNGQIHSVCKLADPCVQKTHVVEEEIRGEGRVDFVGVEIRASRHGWVLFSKEIDPYKFNGPILFFLYCPFTNEIIMLPQLSDDYVAQVTFSLDSDTPDCVVFCLRRRRSLMPRKFYLSTCKPGDTTWTDLLELEFDHCENMIDVAYHNGFFYVLFKNGKLGAFNVAIKEWTLFTSEWETAYFCHHYLIPCCDGDLRVLIKLDRNQSEILRFDFSNKRWVNENSLGNQAVFLGGTSFSVPATDELLIADNILLHYHQGCAIENKDFGQLYDFYAWIPATLTLNEGLKHTWIQPPVTGIWRAGDLLQSNS